MIEIDTSGTLLVQEGVPWPHKKEPCSREMIHLLERAESFVSWFQPRNGCVDDQFPTIRVGHRYCKLSLRLQKALFRHVRLQRDFVNRERTPDGVVKLRIPTTLFMDKKKTASRFMVRDHPISPCLDDCYFPLHIACYLTTRDTTMCTPYTEHAQ